MVFVDAYVIFELQWYTNPRRPIALLSTLGPFVRESTSKQWISPTKPSECNNDVVEMKRLTNNGLTKEILFYSGDVVVLFVRSAISAKFVC